MELQKLDPLKDEDLPAEVGWYGDNFREALEDLALGHWTTRVMARALDAAASAVIERHDGAGGWRAPTGSFDYITIEIPRFLRLLRQLDLTLGADPDYRVAGLRYRPLRFLEIGCGPGRNLRLIRDGAPLLWAELTGIDIAAPLVEAGRAVSAPDITLLTADAMEFDVSGFDAIFSYRPFSDDTLQLAFEERLRRQMKIGAYLVAPLAMNRDSSARMLQIDRGGDIWKKLA